MKNLILLFSIFLAVNVSAATSITTPTVSGHWTLSGSPYLVFNDIDIAATQSLVIDPGVQVIFQGGYRLRALGIFRVKGTASQRIVFTVNDTTGWAGATPGGGWRGILIATYSGTATDTSAMEYCDVTNVKIDTAASMAMCYALFVERSLSIKNCNVFHNRSQYIDPLLHFACQAPHGPQWLQRPSLRR